MKELLLEYLSYDPLTGVFRWKKRAALRVQIGDVAGSLGKDGYLHIGFKGKNIRAARLAFVFMTGDWPKGEADHENGVRSDNCWDNLRDVPHSVNMHNRRKSPKNAVLGVLGVSKTGDKFRACISVNHKTRYLGTFPTIAEAHDCYLEAKRKLHEGCLI